MRFDHESKGRRSDGNDQIRCAVAIFLEIPILKFSLRFLVRKKIGVQIFLIKFNLVRRVPQHGEDFLIDGVDAGGPQAELVEDKDALDGLYLTGSKGREAKTYQDARKEAGQAQ